MCLPWDVLFSRIPAKGWQGQKGRGWHQSILYGLPIRRLFQRRDLDSLAGTRRASSASYLLCFLISSSQALLSHYILKKKKKKKASKSCAKMCLSFLWHEYNCQSTRGHTTWGTGFLQQMEFCWSRSRPTAGVLEQMLCSPSLGVSVSGFSSGWCSTFLQITCRHGQSPTTLHLPSPRVSPELHACQVSVSSRGKKESFSGHRAVCN